MRPQYVLPFLIFATALIALAGCELTGIHNPAEIPGTYKAVYYPIRDPGAAEKLILLPNGDFIQMVTLKKTGKVIVARGKWDYLEKLGAVGFDDHYLLVTAGPSIDISSIGKLRPDFEKPQRGGAGMTVMRWFGQIRIGSDEHVDYQRIGPVPKDLEADGSS
jgi:hypothetical protein